MRTHVILAVLKRNLLSYFSGVLGYLFIMVFVIAAAFCAFNAQFFTSNLANLDQLTQKFPYLLLFIIPAITMTAWADEKRQGTDELLFTLPASDVEILLGKYLSLVLVYSVALAFSLTMLGVLGYYADPDWGLLLTTYFGYWLAGSTLISLGMFASALTGSVTVAFVLGAAICAVPVFVGLLSSARPLVSEPRLSDRLDDLLSLLFRELSLSERLSEFTMGVVPVSGLVYFASLTGFALYLNAALIGRRHWVSRKGEVPMGSHIVMRAICLLVGLIACNSFISSASESLGLRFDLTAENLYTLSDTTEDLMRKIEKENPVTIQAFLSPQVPREYVGHLTRLKGLLRQYDRMGGQLIDVRFVEVTPFSEEAEEARHFGIEPLRVPAENEGRYEAADMFMGAVISSPYDQVVIPFFEPGTSTEYELTRSIRTVSQKERLTVGMLRTDAKVNGGFDMQSMRSSAEWRIQRELKKQYTVKEISPDSKIEEKVDVLVAVLPSSLTQPQLDNFVEYAKSGKPVLILDDPMPLNDLRNAPSQRKQAQGGMGGMFGGSPPPEQRAYDGTAKPLVDLLEIEWQNNVVVWDLTNPHPQFAEIPPEYVFITPLNKNPEAINRESDVTSGLQEVLVLNAGRVRWLPSSKLKHEPLLRIGTDSGYVRFDDLIEASFFGMQMKDPRTVRRSLSPAGEQGEVVAARITGENNGNKVDAIYVADVDIVSDALFNVVQSEMHGLKLDNVKFILNCVDVLAGDKSYVELRKRRPQHRALKEIQRQADEYRREAVKEQELAEEETRKEKDKLQAELDSDIEKIRKDDSLTRIEKEQRMQMAEQRRQRELDVRQASIDREKQEKIQKLKAREQRQIRQMEDGIRLKAVLFPPLPAIALGLVVYILRLMAEQSTIEENRRRR